MAINSRGHWRFVSRRISLLVKAFAHRLTVDFACLFRCRCYFAKSRLVPSASAAKCGDGPRPRMPTEAKQSVAAARLTLRPSTSADSVGPQRCFHRSPIVRLVAASGATVVEGLTPLLFGDGSLFCFRLDAIPIRREAISLFHERKMWREHFSASYVNVSVIVCVFSVFRISKWRDLQELVTSPQKHYCHRRHTFY